MKPHHSTNSSTSTPSQPSARPAFASGYNVNAPGFQPQYLQQQQQLPPHYHPQQQQQYHPHHHQQQQQHYQGGGGGPRGHYQHQHQEYRPKGGVPPAAAAQQQHEVQDPAQLPPPENGDAIPHNPYKQHARPYNGPVFVPGAGIPQGVPNHQASPQQQPMRGPPAPQGGGGGYSQPYQQRMRGPPRGAPHGQQQYVPRGAIPQQHPQAYYPHVQQMPPAYMMGGQPGMNMYMPAPMQYLPMQNVNMGIPGGMPMQMHQQPQHQPPPKREKKALLIVNPKTGKPINMGSKKDDDTEEQPVPTAAAPALAAAPVATKAKAEVAPAAPKAATATAAATPAKTASASAPTLLSPKKDANKQNGTPKSPTKSPQKKAAPVAEKTATPKKEPAAVAPVEAPVEAPAKKEEAKPAAVESKPAKNGSVAAAPVAAPAATAPAVASPKATAKKEPAVVAQQQPVSPKKAAKVDVSPKKKAPVKEESAPSPTKQAVKEETKVEQPKAAVPEKTTVVTTVVTESVKEVSVAACKTSASGKTTYSVEFLFSFRESYTELPEAVTGPDSKWPTMEVVNDGPSRGSSRGGRGGGGGSGASNWERSEKQAGGAALTRQSSRGASGGGGGNQWARSQDLPKRGRGERGGGGGRGGRGGRGQTPEPLFDGPVKPLDRSDNRWIPVKATAGLEAAKKKVYSIMNKMTREKFDRLAMQLTDIDMESLEMLQGVITILFDKALGEPHFCDMYADLCVHLELHWKVWSFLQIVQNDDDNTFYWTTMAEADTEVVGPFDSLSESLESAKSDEFEPSQAPPNLKLSEVRIQNQKFIKIWAEEGQDGQPKQYYWSGQLLEDLGDEQPLNGPFESFDHAKRTAIKGCSFKRILLNACQEEFEKDNIYEELEETYKKNKREDKVTPEMEAEYQEKRMLMKRRMLGNIRFIGELYRKGMLQERIMHECIMKLMGVHVKDSVLAAVHPGDIPDEENLESLCKLLSTMGKDLDKKNSGQGAMNSYFQYLEKVLLKDKRLCSRINFMIKDAIDLRSNRWEPRRKELKTKTLTEIRKEAERELAKPPVSAPSGGGGGGGGGGGRGDRGDRSDSFRMENRRSNSSRDNFSSQGRSTMAPVYSSQSMNSRSSGNNKMTLPIDRGARNIQRDDSIKTGPQGRPASFGGAAPRSSRGGAPTSGTGGAPASFSSRSRNNQAAPESSSSSSAKSQAAKEEASKPEPLSEAAKEKIAKRAKSTAEEYVSIVDINEADTCLAELMKEFKDHPEVPHMFAKEILQSAIEAKTNVRDGMFNMLEKLVLEKKSLPYASIRFGIEKMIELGVDLWCDVPKLHEHVADIVVRFMKESATTGVSFDWLVCGCGKQLDGEIFEEVVQGGFLAASAGHSLKLLKKIDLEKAKNEVRATYSMLQSLFASHDRDAKSIQKWIAKFDIGDVLPLEPAFGLVELANNTESYEEVVAWIEKNIPIALRTDSVFATHTCLFILDHYKKGELPSPERCMLLTGFCGDVETQARLVSGIFQTRTDSDEVKQLLKHLKKEGAVMPTAFSKWLELKSDTSASRKQAVEQYGSFVDELARSK
ncbi:Eukaryotic translation initiation factor 4 gamma [Globisporangium polare]